MNQLKNILKSRMLKSTECRLHVLNCFITRNVALSQRDLENALQQFDRVTLYRTLNSFLKAGLLHKIPNAEGAAAYGICPDTCSTHAHSHDHVHFKCTTCGTMQCLDDQPIPKIVLPDGYHIKTVNLIIDGVCIKCI